MKLIYTILGSALLFSSLNASQNAQELFDAKCLACHKKTKPADMSSLIAPPIMGVMRHVKMSYPNKNDAVGFIVKYVLHPDKKISVCMPQKIQKFGLMPSQKGNVTKDELKTIASWMYDNFPPKGFKGMGHKMHMGKRNKQISKSNTKKKNSPFLITNALPHLSKLVKMRWDDKTLALTQNQKTKLLDLREKTMNSIQTLKPQINKIQKKIIKMTKNSADTKKIFTLLDKLASLKAEASKTHVSCILETKKILTPSQLYYIKQR